MRKGGARDCGHAAPGLSRVATDADADAAADGDAGAEADVGADAGVGVPG